MKLLLDQSERRLSVLREQFPFISGQLLTPLTNYAVARDGPLAVDNGAFSRFDPPAYRRLLEKVQPHRDRVLFVTVPDVVGSARRTLEVFHAWSDRLLEWPLALVLQDGIEDLDIPWSAIRAVFVGGSDEFKSSEAACHVIKAAQCLELHTHVGRVNTPKRWRRCESLHVDTCDGSGVARFTWMLRDILNHSHDTMPLFEPRTA